MITQTARRGTANPLRRPAQVHGGQDLRVKAYSLFRLEIDAPVALK